MASLSTHIPKEITDYQEKIIGNLTLRQLAALSAAILAGCLTFALCFFCFGLNAEQSSYFIMASALLPAAIGFIRPHDMDFEKYLIMRYRHWQRSKPIGYKTTLRGVNKNVSIPNKEKPQKAKSRSNECVVEYYIYNAQQEAKAIKLAKRNNRRAYRAIQKAEKERLKQKQQS